MQYLSARPFTKIEPFLRPGDDFITSLVVKNASERQYTLLLCKQSISKIKLIDDKETLGWRVEWTEVHSIEASSGSSNPLAIQIFHAPNAKDKKQKTKAVTMPSGMTLRCRSYVLSTPEGKNEAILLMNRLLQDAWQAAMESRLVPAPEVYQFHMFLCKVNAHGKHQIRLLCASTKRIYNAKLSLGESPASLKESQWTTPISALSKVSTYRQSPLAFTLHFHKAELQRGVRPEYSFITKDELEKNLVVAELRRIYYLLMNSPLAEEILDTLTVSE